MPSPFPGMDPYLENPDEWHSFHTSFIAYLADSLNQRLPQAYAAKIEERLVVLQDERDIFSDVSIRWRRTSDTGGSARDRTATVERNPNATVPDPPLFLRVEPTTIKERFIQIIAVRDKRQVVTIIEVLSPTNKAGEGRTKYLRKQREILRSRVSLLEIDLLRGGAPTAAIPITGLRVRAPYDYIVGLNRADQRERVAYWPFTLRDRLPRIIVPLHEGAPDITEDLQTTFETTYDRGAYARMLDYDVPITPSLPPEDSAWVQKILASESD